MDVLEEDLLLDFESLGLLEEEDDDDNEDEDEEDLV